MSKYQENLKIAKLAYKEIKSAIDKFENDTNHQINLCWDECIWVNGDFFNSHELH